MVVRINTIKYLAKSKSPDGREETVKSHLEEVATLAGEYGKPLGMENLAKMCGLLHDFGKYGTPFQELLRNIASRIDHALPGASLLCAMRQMRIENSPTYKACVEVIAGHHSGLESYPSFSGKIKESLTQGIAEVINHDKTCSIPNKDGETIQGAASILMNDFPDIQKKYLSNLENPFCGIDDDAGVMLLTRMLFSCLVDADYSASANFDNPLYLSQYSGGKLNADRAEEALEAYMKSIRESSTANPVVDAVRNELYEDCAAAGDTQDWLMTATAPTGAGKTLALLKLAIRKCRTLGLSRIIVVLPFLTIADQTEGEYRKIIPNLIVDHSQSKLSDEQREFAARWDAPCIITTSVKFFESLFSRGGPDCRKLHNIANSVVIFDEAQTLPNKITKPTIKAILALCERCRTAMILSTATQPAFEYLEPDWKPSEVVKDIDSMYQRMRRTEMEWRIKENTPLSVIANEAGQKNQCCVITNLKSHAAAIYSEWGNRDGTYLMSTALCPAHRKAILAEIKERLEAGKPCLVSATQCIEAGVSIDFPVMYRALAPLSSISQAAGRCNRHGKLSHPGKVVVFVPGNEEDEEEAKRIYPDTWYQHEALTAKGLIMTQGMSVDINDPEVIKAYYKRLYVSGSGGDEKLEKAISMRDFEAVDNLYNIISSDGYEVIVPFDDGNKTFSRVKDAVTAGDGIVQPHLIKETAGITVSVFAKEADLLDVCEPIYFWNPRLREKYPSGKYIVRTGCESCYDKKIGLTIKKRQTSSLLGI